MGHQPGMLRRGSQSEEAKRKGWEMGKREGREVVQGCRRIRGSNNAGAHQRTVENVNCKEAPGMAATREDGRNTSSVKLKLAR